MDDAAQWRLYRSSLTCARRLSTSAVLLLDVIGDVSARIRADEPIDGDVIAADLQSVLEHICDGIRESREVLPLLETYAQALVSRQVELPASSLSTSSSIYMYTVYIYSVCPP
jgi:hypothetical protein